MEIKDWIEIAGLGVAVGALLATLHSVVLNRKTNRAQFWLNLREQFSRHSDVHLKLRHGGEWTESGKGPASAQEWAQLDAYMGLFEHCEIMLHEKLIDIRTFTAIYKYRVQNILANKTIVTEKLGNEKSNWQDFIGLVRRLQLEEPGQESAHGS